jgi:hypothetical protein
MMTTTSAKTCPDWRHSAKASDPPALLAPVVAFPHLVASFSAVLAMGNLTKLSVDSSYHVPSVVGEYKSRPPCVRTCQPRFGFCTSATRISLTGLEFYCPLL